MVSIPKDTDIDRAFLLLCLLGLVITKVGELLNKQE
jgi:hypothetical protein